MLRAAAAKKDNGRIDSGKIANCLRYAFLPSATWRRPRRPQPTR